VSVWRKLSQCQGNRFRAHRTDDGHLLAWIVTADRFRGDLNGQLLPDPCSNFRNGLPISIRIKKMTACGVSHMEVHHAGSRIEAIGCRICQLRRSDGEGGMIRFGVASAVGRYGYAQWAQECLCLLSTGSAIVAVPDAKHVGSYDLLALLCM
jgi:hypothetical protein